MPRPFAILDVFTDRRFGGNQLGLVADARGLDAATMQALAAELGFSETIFLFPPDDPANDLRARIFTPASELPFAGHPNVGLGVWAASQAELFGRRVGGRLRAEEGAGLVVLDLERSDHGASATLTAPAPLSVGAAFPVERVARAARLAPADVATARHAPVLASVGTGFVLCELVSREALRSARPDPSVFDPLGARGGLCEALYYVRDGDRVAMRMFAPPQGIDEDPATGSAVAALAAFLAHLEPAADADLALSITQGDEIGRPSRIRASASKRGGVVGPVRVGGTAVLVAAGMLEI